MIIKKKIKKSNFYENKKINKIDGVNVNNILVSKKEPYSIKNSFKYFVGYNDNGIIRPLCIRLPQMTGYVRKFNENLTMPFRVWYYSTIVHKTPANDWIC